MPQQRQQKQQRQQQRQPPQPHKTQPWPLLQVSRMNSARSIHCCWFLCWVSGRTGGREGGKAGGGGIEVCDFLADHPTFSHKHNRPLHPFSLPGQGLQVLLLTRVRIEFALLPLPPSFLPFLIPSLPPSLPPQVRRCHSGGSHCRRTGASLLPFQRRAGLPLLPTRTLLFPVSTAYHL